MTKYEKSIFVNQYMVKFAHPDIVYLGEPNMVFNGWIRWLFEMWDKGLISIKQYRALIRIDLDDYIGTEYKLSDYKRG